MVGRGLVVSFGIWACGCGAFGPGPSREPVQEAPTDAVSAVVRYTSEARPSGASAGAAAVRLRDELAAALKQRGDVAEVDGALSATASWGLREAREGRTVDFMRAEGAARRQGFGGVVHAFVVFDEEHKSSWREQLARTSTNVPITRFGLSTSADGRFAAVVFGSVEVEYQPIARAFEAGQQVDVKGRVAERFQSCQVYLTKPDGTVIDKRLTSREFDVSFPLAAPGKYRVEVMGDGTTGPVVLANLPIYVGVPEPEVEEAVGAVVSPAEAESRLLKLLNDARLSAGLGLLQTDEALRRVASEHSLDMAEHGFFGHVSPTTGGPEDRVRSSGILVSLFGENVGMAGTPEVIHASLMSSPGHRANMLQGRFTHVGIAVTKSDGGLVATYLFALRPGSEPTSAN